VERLLCIENRSAYSANAGTQPTLALLSSTLALAFSFKLSAPGKIVESKNVGFYGALSPNDVVKYNMYRASLSSCTHYCASGTDFSSKCKAKSDENCHQ
jgi:hypothetical protein